MIRYLVAAIYAAAFLAFMIGMAAFTAWGFSPFHWEPAIRAIWFIFTAFGCSFSSAVGYHRISAGGVKK